MTNDNLSRPEPAAAEASSPPASSRPAVRLAEPDEWVSLNNPDDPDDLPIYEGLAGAAGQLLIAGEYTGFDADDYPVSVAVTD